MRKLTCLILTFVLLIAPAIPVGAASPTQGVAQFANSYVPFLFGDVKEAGPEWLTRTDLQLRFDDLLKPQYSVETVQPLGVLPSGQAFWQGRLGTDGVGKKPTLNLGLGYRALQSDGTKLLGVNGFYDKSFENDFARIGVGGEFFMGGFEARANAYFPTTGAVEVSRTDTERTMERAVTGYDFEVGGALPKAPWLEVYGGGKLYVHEHSDNVSSLTARTQMQLTPHLKLEAGYQANPENKYVKLGYTLGPSDRFSLADLKKKEIKLPDLSDKLLEKVERDNTIRTETWTEKLSEDPEAPAATVGTLEGYLYMNSDWVMLLSDSATPPSGFSPLDGGTVTVTPVDGTPVTVPVDAQGHFSIPNVSSEATITANDGYDDLLECSITVAGGKLVPAPHGTVEGYVFSDGASSYLVRPTNTAPAGYTAATFKWVDLGAAWFLGADTDGTGHFSIPYVPEGHYTLSVGKLSDSITVVGDQTATPSLGTPLTAGRISGYAYLDSTNLSLKLTNSATVPSGYHPAVGAQFIMDKNTYVPVGADGAFDASTVWPGDHKLVFDRDSNLIVISDTIPVTVADGQNFVLTGDQALAPTGSIQGYVLENGSNMIIRASDTRPQYTSYAPSAGARVTIGGTTVTSDASGYFVLTIPSGTGLTLSAIDSDNYHTASGTVNLSPGTTVDVPDIGTTQLSYGALQGYAYWDGSKVIIRPSSTPPGGAVPVVSAMIYCMEGGGSAFTDANGHFVWSASPGNYTIVVSAPADHPDWWGYGLPRGSATVTLGVTGDLILDTSQS